MSASEHQVISRSKIADLQRNAGQALVIGFDGTEVSPQLSSLLACVQPAGIILFARNIVSPQQTHELLRQCRRLLKITPFLCVDMEGGLVDRLKKAIAPAPSPVDVFATRDRKLFRKHGKNIGEECRAIGFNTDFAPVSDLAFAASRTVLGSRAVSADPKQTIVYVREFLKGLRETGVLGCGKHFPGLGEGSLDSHTHLPVIQKTWKRLWNEDLLPYRVLRRDYPIVMVSHAAYPEVSGKNTPASLSQEWITDILRKKIGFRGLIASDDLEMGGALSAGPVEQAAVQHLAAGGNMALICHKEEFVMKSYEALIHEAERNPKFASLLSKSASQVMAFKRKVPQLARRVPPPTVVKMEAISRRLWEFSEQVRLETLNRQESA
jgi:beta-N-acetylhexosaminidase